MFFTKKYIDYWILFVESLYILLQSKIRISALNRADELLHKFVALTEEYFGPSEMTYNIHILLHLCQSVMNWDPLWTHSNFPFESGNYHLLKAINCAKGVPHQILRYTNLIHCKRILQERVHSKLSLVIKHYCDQIFTRN